MNCCNPNIKPELDLNLACEVRYGHEDKVLISVCSIFIVDDENLSKKVAIVTIKTLNTQFLSG